MTRPITNPVELRRAGVEALVRELGYVNAMRFLLQFDPGQGDYTQERRLLLPDRSVEQLLEDSRGLPPGPQCTT